MLEVIKKEAAVKKFKHPILCLHGAQGGAWYFETYLNYYSQQGYDVYAMSLRGHGKSDGYEKIDTFGIDDYVDDLLEVVLSLEEKPILFAHSMGGAIAQRFLNKHQDNIHALFLLSSAPAGGIDKDSDLGLYYRDQLAFLRKVKKEKGMHMTLDRLMKETVFSASYQDDEMDMIRKRFTKESDRMKIDLLNTFLDDDVKIHIPVFVYGSHSDGILRVSDIKKTAERFQTKAIFVERLSHFVTLDPYYMDLLLAIDENLFDVSKKL